nr:MAG TPA: hypothetical protein [Caudoviricetes sp.]
MVALFIQGFFYFPKKTLYKYILVCYAIYVVRKTRLFVLGGKI